MSSASDRIRSHLEHEHLSERDNQTVHSTENVSPKEQEGAAAASTAVGGRVPQYYHKSKLVVLSVSAAEEDAERKRQKAALGTAVASATAIPSTTIRNKKRATDSVHPLDVIENTFDPIPPHKIPSFVCDFSLFRVAKSLRLLGYDVRCEPALLGDDIIHVARADKRIIITGSTRQLPKLAKMRKDDIAYRNGKPAPPKVVVGYDSDGGSVYETDSEFGHDDDDDDDFALGYVKVHSSDSHDESMLRVLQTLQLPWDESRVFTRCVDCNVLIESVPNKEDVRGLVPAGVFEMYTNFYHCSCCKKVYWGVDNGVAVNYKSVRTIEYLRQYRGAFANGGNSEEIVAKTAAAEAEAEGDCGAHHHNSNTNTEDGASASPPAAGEGSSSGGATCSGAVLRSHNGASVDALRAPNRSNRFCDFTLRRHFSSLPRTVKQRVFSFMTSEDILAVAEAVPTARQLALAASKGEVFVPTMNSRQLKREYRKRQLIAAEQTGQAPFVRGTLKKMMNESN